MPGYRIALFFHLLALLSATSASALVHFADARRRRATTAGEALQWLALAGRSARAFPLTLAAFLLTGGYMVAAAAPALSWSSGWVVAGVAGVAALFVSGAVLGRRGRAAAQALARAAAGGEGAPAPTVADPLNAALGSANTGIALAVVFVMVAKPPALAAFTVLAAGAALGAALGVRAAGGAPVPHLVAARGTEREAEPA